MLNFALLEKGKKLSEKEFIYIYIFANGDKTEEEENRRRINLHLIKWKENLILIVKCYGNKTEEE